MTTPRLLARGATYLVTRRCSQRQFLLRPGVETNRVFLYCLAVAAERAKVEVHAFVQMPTHWHGVVTDPEARLPEFLQLLHRLVASAMNSILGRRENFWASGHTSVVVLETDDDVLDKLAYVIANPATAGLVDSPDKWPGVITSALGEHHVAERPRDYFRGQGSMPAQAALECTIPPALRRRELGKVKEQLRSLVSEAIRRAKSVLRAAGRAFRGTARVLAASVAHSATTLEPSGGRAPAVAARDPTILAAAVSRLREFRRAYGLALERWREGDRFVNFPEGTYLMRVLHRASCGPEPLG